MYNKLLILLLAIGSTFAVLNSQTTDNRGKEFWLTFPPNFHSIGSGQNTDSLILFFSADTTTNIVVEMRDVNGNTEIKNINISNPKLAYSTGVSYKNYELRGFNNYLNSSQRDQTTFQTGIPASQYFKITSDNDISVIGFSKAALSFDAFLTMPTPTLGKEYIVLAYPNDVSFPQGMTPSQFAILATEDSTVVSIKPSVQSFNFGSQEKTINLQKGESFLMQAQIDGKQSTGDLTGTIVKSNNKIAIFSGQQRANIPIELNNTGATRDMILEQLPPIKFWGRQVLITPFPKLSGIWAAYDVFRVIASEDSTIVKVNNKEVILLKGQIYEAPLDNNYNIVASAPILVALYKQTSQDNGATSSIFTSSDPLMLFVPPVEKYIKSNKFISLQTTQISQGTGSIANSFVSQYLTMFVPNSALSSVFIDDFNVPASNFLPINGSNYSYYTSKVTDGLHEIKANEEIGTYVYGFGEAGSYGYTGGMSLKSSDYNSPKYNYNTGCLSVNGTITDSLEFDSGIMNVDIPALKNDNCIVEVQNKNTLQKATNFSAELNDKNLDGSFDLIAIDSIGYYKKKSFSIYGLTVGANPNPKQIGNSTDTTNWTKDICKEIEIVNYGSVPKLLNIVSKYGNITFDSNFPKGEFTLKPNDKLKFNYCMNSNKLKDTTLLDTIIAEFINSNCETRNLVAVSFTRKENFTNIENENNMQLFEIYPNPAKNELKVNITLALPSIVEINLISILGTTIPLDKLNLINGSSLLTFDLTKIPSGTYQIELKTDTKVYKGSLQIEK